MSLWTAVRRRWPRIVAGGGALAAVALGFWTASGATGLAIAITVAAVWVFVPTVYAVAVGGLLLGTLAASGGVEAPLAAGSLLALFAADLLIDWPLRTALLALAVLGAAGGLFATIWSTEPPWVAGAVLLGGFALFTYAIHRYELVRLGLVEGAEP